MADMATLIYDIDSSAARSAATDLAKLNSASIRAAGGADKLNKTLRDSQGRFRSSFDVAKDYGSEVQALAAKYNPALSAVYKYQEAQLELNRAVALGVLTQGQADAALAGVSAGLQRAAANAMGYTSSMRGVNNIQSSVGNQFAQLNDVVVTAWGGMNPALIGMQQGMQMVQGFAGQSLPQALGTLRGAFAQLLNPMALVTVGAVTVAAAALQFGLSFIGAASDTKTFKDAVGDAEAAIKRIAESSTLLSRGGLDELREKYGQVNDEIRSLVEAERLLSIAESAKEVNAAIQLITQSLGDGMFNTAYSEIERVFEVGANQAQNLYGVLVRIGDNKSLEGQLGTIIRFREQLSSVTNGFTDMTDEQADMLANLTQAESIIRQLQNTLSKTPSVINAATNATAEWERAMSGVLSYINAVMSSLNNISGGAIRLAAIKTETELLKQGVSLREASYAATVKTAELEGDQRTKALEMQYGWAGKLLGIAEKNSKLSIITAEKQLDIERDAAREREKSGGGGGAKELAAAEKGFQSLQELMQRESIFQVAEWQKRQAQLDEALAKKLVSEQNYQMLRQQLQMLYFGSEYERNAIQYQMDLDQLQASFDQRLLTEQQYLMQRSALQHQYYSDAIGVDQSAAAQQLGQMAADFGQMNQLAGGGYDSLLRAQKTFAAGSALINAYLAATQAMADPTVPYWMKVAAYAKVLAAGLGAVNAIKGGGGSGGRGSAATAATKQEPTKNILVNLTGPAFMVDMAEEIMQQIYAQSKDGRVIIARDVT